jgi:hypothetical protein
MKGYVISVGYGYYNIDDDLFHDIYRTRGTFTVFNTRKTAHSHMKKLPDSFIPYLKIVEVNFGGGL